MSSAAPNPHETAIIRTFTGRMIDLLLPDPEQISLRDIAHALGQINRYTGHTPEPYTVAEHCVLGSYVISPELALDFLLHDAPEAYLGDVSGPLKKVMGGRYEELEWKWAQAVAQHFDLDPGDNDAALHEVERIDRLMLHVELDRLMGLQMRPASWLQCGSEAERIYTALGRREGSPELRFLARAEELLRQRGKA